jgi:hypothetical protein
MNMKTKLILFIAILGFGMASCEKCTDCTCVGSNVFEFDPGITADERANIEELYTQEFEDSAETFCDNSQDEVDAYEDEWETKSRSFDESQVLNGNAWSIDADYVCTCVQEE